MYPTGIWPAEVSKPGVQPVSACRDDETLIALVQGGDQTALETLLDRYGQLVLGIGMRVLHDSFEAQELVQDAFLQVYRKCRLFDPAKGSLRTWLMRLAYNRAFNRREYLNLHRFYDGCSLEDFAEVVSSSVDVEYQIRVRQAEAELRRIFDELNPQQRNTLELYFFEGYTLREISEHLNESLGNVRHYYYRALDKLKASLKESGR